MAQQFTNNARALLTSSITDSATSIVIEATKADLFPVANVGSGSIPSASSWFKVTLQDSSGNVEIVAVRTRTAGSGVLANVIRGYDGTTARSFVTGTVVGLRVTAEDIQTALDLPNQNSVFTGDNSFTGTNEFVGGLIGDVTGDVTGDLIGNASTATALATGRTLALTGDVTYTSPTFNGTSNVTAAATLASTGVTAGAYTTPNVTVDAKGRVTSMSAGTGVLRLITRQSVFATGTPNGSTITVSLPTSLFGGVTPSFVMFSAAAIVGGVTDLRYFRMCSGTTDTTADIVLGSTSDDTDQSGTGTGCAASTFVLPYNASQQFYCLLYGATLYMHVIGYQV